VFKLLLIGIVGLLAQLIDGALGMAYGVTSTTLLLTVGVAPAAASASVHLAELGTTLASGTAHWRFGNVDWRVVLLMSLPGAAGAFAGALVLSSFSAEVAAPFVAGFLFLLGVYILVRFARRAPDAGPRKHRPLRGVFLAPLGLFAGFMDAAGGGGWGPIGTPALLSSNRLSPRKVIGSVDTAEFLVAVGASAGFLVSLSFSELNPAWVGALLVGGLIAAPVAAWLVRRLPPQILGVSVGGLILLTNARTIGEAAGASAELLTAAYLTFVALWLALLASAIVTLRRERAAQPA
jgi:uncharacterized membrane protein YfcA